MFFKNPFVCKFITWAEKEVASKNGLKKLYGQQGHLLSPIKVTNKLS